MSTVSRVIEPDTGKVLALEITANNGNTYFVAADPFWQGLRVGAFPNMDDGNRFPRDEIARLESDE